MVQCLIANFTSVQVFSLLQLLGNYHCLQLKHIGDREGKETLSRQQSYAAFERDLNTFSIIDLCNPFTFSLAPVTADFILTLVDL